MDLSVRMYVSLVGRSMGLGILLVGVGLIGVVHIANNFCKCICALFMSKREIQIVSMVIVCVNCVHLINSSRIF